MYIYTSVENKDGKSGFMPVYISEQITKEEAGEIEEQCIYIPPKDMPTMPVEDELNNYPKSYAYFRLKSGRKCIMQTTYKGKDYSGRYGNYITNAIVKEELNPLTIDMSVFKTDTNESEPEIKYIEEKIPVINEEIKTFLNNVLCAKITNKTVILQTKTPFIYLNALNLIKNIDCTFNTYTSNAVDEKYLINMVYEMPHCGFNTVNGLDTPEYEFEYLNCMINFSKDDKEKLLNMTKTKSLYSLYQLEKFLLTYLSIAKHKKLDKLALISSDKKSKNIFKTIAEKLRNNKEYERK